MEFLIVYVIVARAIKSGVLYNVHIINAARWIALDWIGSDRMSISYVYYVYVLVGYFFSLFFSALLAW